MSSISPDPVTESYQEKFQEIEKCSQLKETLLTAFQELNNLCRLYLIRNGKQRQLEIVRRVSKV